MPLFLKRLTMPFWAGLFYALLPKARRAVDKNLRKLLGPASFLQEQQRSFRLFRNYAQMISDTYSLHLDVPIDMEVVSIGRDNVVTAVEKGCGVVAVTGHLGMWQVAPFLADWRGLPTFYQAMAQEPNPMVQAFEERFRGRFRIIYTTETPFAVLRLAKVLREGGVLGMQIDRHLGGQTMELPFCGQTAWFSTGAVMLARATGAPLVPSFFIVEEQAGNRRRVAHYLETPIEVAHTRDRQADIAAAMTKLIAVYERFVLRSPTQWYHFYDFFAPPAAEPAANLPTPLNSAAAPVPVQDTP